MEKLPVKISISRNRIYTDYKLRPKSYKKGYKRG